MWNDNTVEPEINKLIVVKFNRGQQIRFARNIGNIILFEGGDGRPLFDIEQWQYWDVIERDWIVYNEIKDDYFELTEQLSLKD